MEAPSIASAFKYCRERQSVFARHSGKAMIIRRSELAGKRGSSSKVPRLPHYGPQAQLARHSGLILEVVFEAGTPRAERFVPMLERQIGPRCGMPPRRSQPMAVFHATHLTAGQGRARHGWRFPQSGPAVERHFDVPLVTVSCVDFSRRDRCPSISCLKRAYGLASCTCAFSSISIPYIWSAVVAANLVLLAPSNRASPGPTQASMTARPSNPAFPTPRSQTILIRFRRYFIANAASLCWLTDQPPPFYTSKNTCFMGG